MKNTINKIKKHVVEHKEVYISIAATSVITAAATILVINRAQIHSQVTQKAVISWRPVMEQNTNVIIQAPGNSGNVLQDDLGNIFASQNSAAKILGVDPRTIREHLNGRVDNVMGRTLTKVIDGSPQHTLAA